MAVPLNAEILYGHCIFSQLTNYRSQEKTLLPIWTGEFLPPLKKKVVSEYSL